MLFAATDVGRLADARGAISWTSQVRGVAVAAESRPSDGLGGDFYGVVLGDHDRLTVLIGDACGKGAPAARIATHLRVLFDTLARSVHGPAALLEALNSRLVGTLSDDTFVTAACIDLDPSSERLTVANAGHVPVLVRSDESSVLAVGAPSGPPLGMLARATYREESIELDGSELLLLVTDGVLDALSDDPTGVRLSRLVAATPSDPARVIDRLLDAIESRTSDGRDDLTILCLKLAWQSAPPSATWRRAEAVTIA